MTKVRVCVGVDKQGKYRAYGENNLTDESLRETVLIDKDYDPGLSFSFHDLEVMTPQAPVVKALSSEGHTFEYGDLIEGRDKYSTMLHCGGYKAKYAVVTHSRPSTCEGDNCIAYCAPEDFYQVDKPLDYRGLKAAGIDGNGWQPRYLKVAAKAGNWHIADGEVVLSPPPQPEPEVKTKFQFGDLVKWKYSDTQYVVTHATLQNVDEPGVTVVQPQHFYKVEKPVHYNQLNYLLGFGGEATGRVCDGHDEEYFSLIAPAGQWHINFSGEVVLKPKPEVTKPKFNRGDRVTRMQLGKLETWQVVEPTPDADGMIVLLADGWELASWDTWSMLVRTFGEGLCGKTYRMSYEDDCTLVPEVTAPQSYPGFRVGDMVVDQSNELWDVDEVSVLDTWVTSKNLVGRKKVPTSILKKVVFGTL